MSEIEGRDRAHTREGIISSSGIEASSKTGTPEKTKETGYSSQSTLSKAEQETAASLVASLLQPSIVFLQPPDFSNAENKAVMIVLDSWAKNIKEWAEASKRAAEKDAITKQNQNAQEMQQEILKQAIALEAIAKKTEGVQGVTTSVPSPEGVQRTTGSQSVDSPTTPLGGTTSPEMQETFHRLIHNFAHYAREVKNPHEAQAIFRSFAIGASFTGLFIPVVDASQTTLLTFTPIVELPWNPGIAQIIPTDLNLLVGLIGISEVYRTTVEEVGKRSAGAKGLSNREFLQAYARNVLAYSISPEFRHVLAAILTQESGKGELLSPKQQEAYFYMARALLIMVPLAFTYQVVMGGVTGEELCTLIKDPDALFAKKEFKRIRKGDRKEAVGVLKTLTEGIRSALKALTPREHDAVMSAIQSYGDNPAPKEALFKPLKLLAKDIRALKETVSLEQSV